MLDSETEKRKTIILTENNLVEDILFSVYKVMFLILSPEIYIRSNILVKSGKELACLLQNMCNTEYSKMGTRKSKVKVL
jgi:hypothetical protein